MLEPRTRSRVGLYSRCCCLGNAENKPAAAGAVRAAVNNSVGVMAFARIVAEMKDKPSQAKPSHVNRSEAKRSEAQLSDFAERGAHTSEGSKTGLFSPRRFLLKGGTDIGAQ